MSTITREFTKEQLQQIIETDHVQCGEASSLARIALASLEAVPVGTFKKGPCGYHPSFHEDAVPLYTAPPSPVAVPECFKRLLHHAYGMTMGHDWNKGTMAGHHRTKLCQAVEECRAAMLQGADGTLTNEGTIPVTQFKPVADLYGLTSPTGSETSFTFDAVEARDFVDGGWSCQEYVELERFQEAITNHTEDKLAMVDHSGDSNNMVERVSQSYKLPEEKGASLQLRNLIRKRHAEWSDSTFGNVGPIGPLKHLSKEALEAAAEPDDLSEWADMQFLLWDAQRRAGISDGEITAAMEEKLKVNMARQWPEPKDGEPRLHIKAAPQQEA